MRASLYITISSLSDSYSTGRAEPLVQLLGNSKS